MTDLADMEPFTGLMTRLNALGAAGSTDPLWPVGEHHAFWNDINGNLIDGEVPEGTSWPYATFSDISDTDNDTFTENFVEYYIQFSLFSRSSSKAEIKRMDKDLTALFKDKVFTVSGWTVVIMKRIQGNGPYWTPQETETGTPGYWQFDVDYTILLNKN